MSQDLDSSSSEDENLERLKESIDTNFISDNLFKEFEKKGIITRFLNNLQIVTDYNCRKHER